MTDEEITAMNAIATALKPLSVDERQRFTSLLRCADSAGSPVGPVRPGEWITALLRDYRSYHHTKELQLWAALVVFFGGAVWYLGIDRACIRDGRLTLQHLAVLAAGAMLLFVIKWQNANRKNGAALFEACLDLSSRWLCNKCSPDDFTLVGHPTSPNVMVPKALCDAFTRVKKTAGWQDRLLWIGVAAAGLAVLYHFPLRCYCQAV